MSDEIAAVQSLVNSDSYDTLLKMGFVSPMTSRNLNMIEHYLALKSSGVQPLKAVRDTEKLFRCKQRWVYKVKKDFGV